MAINDLNDGVGKKIVEALKMQSAEHADGEVFVNDDAPEIIEEPIIVEEPIEVIQPKPKASSSKRVKKILEEIEQEVKEQE